MKLLASYVLCIFLPLIFSILPGFEPISFDGFITLMLLSFGAMFSLLVICKYLPDPRIILTLKKTPLDFIISITEAISLFSIIFIIYKIFSIIDINNLINYRNDIFYSSIENPGLIYANGLESLFFNGFKTFALIVLLMAKVLKRRFWLLVLFFCIDSVLKLERGFIVTLLINLILIDFIFKEFKFRRLFLLIISSLLFGIIIYLLINTIRADNRNPFIAFIESYLISPRLFDYIYNNAAENFYSFGFFTLTEPFSPVINVAYKIFNITYLRDDLVNFLDSFHCVYIYSNTECLYYNAYFSGYLYFFRDFNIFGGFIGLSINIAILFILLRTVKNDKLTNIFIICLLNVTFLRFTLIPAFTFQDYFLPIILYIALIKIYNFLNIHKNTL